MSAIGPATTASGGPMWELEATKQLDANADLDDSWEDFLDDQAWEDEQNQLGP